jgi:para-nitrobenzyl esterase
MKTRHKTILAALTAILLLTGAKCAFKATSGSGGGGDGPDNNDNNKVTVASVSNGQFIDGPVEGLRYVSGKLSGATGRQGEFQYEQDQPVRFYIGDVLLGEATRGKTVITPLDLVENGTLDTPAVINIARLLQSLDTIPGDGAITLPPAPAGLAARTGETISASSGHMDFHNDSNFVNSASQMIASHTDGYPFTAVLVDADTARRHLAESLAAAGIPH